MIIENDDGSTTVFRHGRQPEVRPAPGPNHYRVSWEVDVEADSPREAAELAEDCQRSQITGDGMRGVFDVVDEEGNKTQIDLEDECHSESAE